ncbi:unnamed protein product, partial [Chrysoparadoxa australica]
VADTLCIELPEKPAPEPSSSRSIGDGSKEEEAGEKPVRVLWPPLAPQLMSSTSSLLEEGKKQP